MKRDNTIWLWIILLLGVLTFEGMYSRNYYAQQEQEAAQVVQDYSVIEAVYSKDAEAESVQFKTELISYKSDTFRIAVIKDENKSVAKYKIITKAITNEYRILDVNDSLIDINIVPNIEYPYAIVKFSSNKSIENVSNMQLYLPENYSIDIYTSQDSIEYSMTEYSKLN